MEPLNSEIANYNDCWLVELSANEPMIAFTLFMQV